MRYKFLEKGFSHFQNKDSDFKTSKRQFGNQYRYFSPNLYVKKLRNGEKSERKWIMFSEYNGSIFCFVCKIFSNNSNNPFVKDGFSNWKKGEEYICSHENSKDHLKCMMEFLTYSSKNSCIDKNLRVALANDVQYWHKVLRRVLAVVRFLSERGLPFRGSNEVIGSPNNGNFLGIIELIAEFDPFLSEHIKKYANQGRGTVSYLSKTIFEEFIEAMAKKVLQHIVQEIKNAKYWGLVLDSTPDLSHVDQLSCVFRYFYNNQVQERFLCFLEIKSHKGQSMCDNVLNLLKEHEIKIEDCRAQTYDNASNMSGKYKGLQACIREVNDLAFYVPCTGHSLNLVGECSVEECTTAINFFGVLQQLYVFLSTSTHRWSILSSQDANVKNLSKTRWSRRSDAAKALCNNFKGVYNTLDIIAHDDEEKREVRHEASNLIKQILKIENSFMAVFWNSVLSRFEQTSQFLQKIDVDLISADKMLKSLIDFVNNLRVQFDEFENKAKKLGEIEKFEYSDSTKRKKIKKLADGNVQANTLYGSDKFRIDSFYVLIDKLSAELTKRSAAYSHITNLFGFLLQLTFIDEDELKIKIDQLLLIYHKDLDSNLSVEIQHFIPLIKNQPKGYFSNVDLIKKGGNEIIIPLKILNWIVDLDMEQMFPNIYIAYRLLITIPIANCETERSFSVLKRIKNVHRSSMADERLSSLSRLSIESDLLRSLNFDDIIQEFAEVKARKKFF